MKKLIYSPPAITVVDFKVEHCFTSGDYASRETVWDKIGLTSSRETYYSTGEDYSEFTDNSGSFTTGWYD